MKFYLKKLLVIVIVLLSAFKPIVAKAEWKQDSTGWWYTEGSSWATGWRLINEKLYYFNSDGYMAHDLVINGYSVGSDGALIQNNNLKNTAQNTGLFDVNVSIKYNIHLNDNLKETNPNIIKATRAALFYMNCDTAKFQHYKINPINVDVLIFDVKEMGTDTWEVDYYIKDSENVEYNKNTYSTVTVRKKEYDNYVGEIVHSMPIYQPRETY